MKMEFFGLSNSFGLENPQHVRATISDSAV